MKRFMNILVGGYSVDAISCIGGNININPNLHVNITPDFSVANLPNVADLHITIADLPEGVNAPLGPTFPNSNQEEVADLQRQVTAQQLVIQNDWHQKVIGVAVSTETSQIYGFPRLHLLRPNLPDEEDSNYSEPDSSEGYQIASWKPSLVYW